MVKQTKRKAAWRKSKIADVEEALEDERLVAKLKQKSPKGQAQEAELFSVDTTGSVAGLSAASRRELARAKIFPLKEPRLNLSASEEAKVSRARRPAPARPKDPEVFDLWAPQPAKEPTPFRIRTQARPAPTRVPETLRANGGQGPAVLPAHEGQSVNPSGSAYEDLACMAAAKELAREQHEEDLERRMRPMTHELRDAQGDEAQGLEPEAQTRAYRAQLCGEAGAAGDAGEDAGEAAGEAAGVRERRKTQAQRNRAVRRKGVHALEEQRLAQRRLERSVGAVGSLLKEMRREDALFQERRALREARRAKRSELQQAGAAPKCRRFGKATVREEALVVPEAADGGLRAARLGGSAVRERLASIVRRGLIQAPAEASAHANLLHKEASRRLKKRRKFRSPLLRDDLLLS